MTSYFANNSDADAIAATLPATLIPAYLALTDAGQKTALLLQASSDIDAAYVYQGRKYDVVNQDTEFPRVAHEPSTVTIPNTGGYPTGGAWGELVWDWDQDTGSAVVPSDVLVAVIYQANFLATPGSTDSFDGQYAGVALEKIGSAERRYEKGNPGADTGLCRRAWLLMRPYQIATGRML